MIKGLPAILHAANAVEVDMAKNQAGSQADGDMLQLLRRNLRKIADGKYLSALRSAGQFIDCVRSDGVS